MRRCCRRRFFRWRRRITFAEGLGFESGVEKRFSEAPIFYWLYTLLIASGAGFVLIPRLPLLKVLLFSQVANGVLLPFVLFYMLTLINRKRIMQEFTNNVSAECDRVVDGDYHDRADGRDDLRGVQVLKTRKRRGTNQHSRNSSAQERWNIPRPLSHSDNLDRFAVATVDNEIRAHRPEQNRERRQIFPHVTHARHPSQSFKLVEELSDPAIGSVYAVHGNVSQISSRSVSASWPRT